MKHTCASSAEPSRGDQLSRASFLILCAVLFLAPVVPDYQLVRPKLLLLEGGLILALLAWALEAAARGRVALRMPALAVPLALYAAAQALFYIVSSEKPVASVELARCAASCAAYGAVTQVVHTPLRRRAALAAWLSGTFLSALYGLMQKNGGFMNIAVPQMDRVMSSFGNPIFFAGFLACSVPLVLGLWRARPRPIDRRLLALALAAMLPALFFAQTRAAYIGLAAGCGVFGLFFVRGRRARAGILGFLVLGGAAFAVATPGLWARQQSHLLIWRDSLTLWLSAPWTGVGSGSFHLHFPAAASAQLRAIWPQGKFIVNDAHNEYLQMLVETGLVGLGIFLFVLAGFVVSMRRARALDPPGEWPVSAACAAAAAVILAQNFFSVDLRFTISSIFLFTLIGLAEAGRDGTRVLELRSPVVRAACAAVALALAWPVGMQVTAGYRAQRSVAATPDFFDEKIIEPARTAADLETLARAHPGQALIHEKLGWVYAKEKDWPRAIANYEKACELNPALPGPPNNLGNIYFLVGDRRQAIRYWAQSIAVNPEQIDSRLNLATAYYYDGRLEESFVQLKEVLARDPGNDKARVMLRQMKE